VPNKRVSGIHGISPGSVGDNREFVVYSSNGIIVRKNTSVGPSLTHQLETIKLRFLTALVITKYNEIFKKHCEI
jgi:hypothetical protein